MKNTGTMMGTRRNRGDRRARLATILLSSAVLLSQTTCQRDDSAKPVGRGPNIVFVMIDTLRADHLGVYGNAAGHSPNLDKIAAEGVLFERTIAPAPWTQPSIASLFCSLYTAVHKVVRGSLAFNSTFQGGEKIAVFDASFRTLAECLRDEGYATAAFVSNPYILPEYGFDQGFDHFDASFASNWARGAEVNAAATAWLKRRDVSKPFFLYLHYMDCHGPYDAAPEFFDPLLKKVEAVPNKRTLNKTEYGRLEYLRTIPKRYENRGRHRALMRYREYWAARYAAGVREMDHYLGELRTSLGELSLWDDSYVIITADHGEALCEHELWGHGWSTHHTDLDIPLILRWPEVLPKGLRVPTLVRLIDVMPTMLEQLRMQPPPEIQGQSLMPLIAGHRPEKSPIAFAEVFKPDWAQRAVYEGDWKLIQTIKTGAMQLYNVVNDPLESKNLADEQESRVLALRRLIEQQAAENAALAADFEAEQIPASKEQIDRLKSLGYIGE